MGACRNFRRGGQAQKSPQKTKKGPPHGKKSAIMRKSSQKPTRGEKGPTQP